MRELLKYFWNCEDLCCDPCEYQFFADVMDDLLPNCASQFTKIPSRTTMRRLIFLPLLTFVLSLGSAAASSRSERANTCYADGEDHPNGAEFVTNNLMHRCVDGKLEVYGCQTDNARKLTVGEDVLDRNGPKHGPWGTSDVMGVVYRCYERDGRTAFQKYACGFQNTPPCDLPKVPFTPEEIDAFSRYKPI